MSLILYPGLHKTGTTLMQKRLLPSLGTAYVGRHYGRDRAFRSDLDDAMHEHLQGLALGNLRVDALAALFVRLAREDGLNLLADETLLRPAGAGGLWDAIGKAAVEVGGVGRLSVFLTVRRQEDLVVSRYLHDLNIKVPSIRGEGPGARLMRKVRKGTPPYTLRAALDSGNPPCQWPHCRPGQGGCPCAGNGHVVGITLGLYDYHSTYLRLRVSLSPEDIVMADLLDPDLRPTGLRRLGRLLSQHGVSTSEGDLNSHFLTRVNPERGRKETGFSRADLDPGELEWVRARCRAEFQPGNEKLARLFGEFSAYLPSPWAPPPVTPSP